MLSRDLLFAAQLTAWALAAPGCDLAMLHFEAHMLAILAVAEQLDQETETNDRQDSALTELEGRIFELQARYDDHDTRIRRVERVAFGAPRPTS